jgi:hypothetical protein
MAKKSTTKQQFALCISRKEPDLEFRKVYRILPDESAEKSKYVRVIDESGEDYLYPASYFVALVVPEKARRALSAVS